ncbi:MAG: hypothetical protein JKY89_00325 [Immundisolibacteraceae bacterium]|nr:hypothetical protein [Immundisolibacteraceae bacterium]
MKQGYHLSKLLKGFFTVQDIARFCNITEQHTYKVLNGTKPLSFKLKMHLYSLCLVLINELKRKVLIAQEDQESSVQQLKEKLSLAERIIKAFDIPRLPNTFDLKSCI